jgi:hypothetical protein
VSVLPSVSSVSNPSARSATRLMLHAWTQASCLAQEPATVAMVADAHADVLAFARARVGSLVQLLAVPSEVALSASRC